MLGHWVRKIILAGLLGGLCMPATANAIFDAAVPVHDTSLDGMQLAQTDLSLWQYANEPVGGAVVEPVLAPEVVSVVPPTSIALLLPARSEALEKIVHAVRTGFMVAWEHEPANIVVHAIETGDLPQDVQAAYQRAIKTHDIVVGPLTRSGVAAIAQEKTVIKPTIALAHPDMGTVEMPRNLLAIGFSVEDEARQMARFIGHGGMQNHGRKLLNAIVVSTDVSWQRRAAAAFVSAWHDMGLQVESVELPTSGGFMDGQGMFELRKRIKTMRPGLLFVALDAAQTVQLRMAIGTEVMIYGISQINPHAREGWMETTALPDLNGVHLFDIPWQLQADHAAVMVYPPLPVHPEQRRGADIERFYALGIDAYRIAHNIASRQNDFTLDGVTGKISVRFGSGAPHFERTMLPAIYREGMVKPLNPR